MVMKMQEVLYECYGWIRNQMTMAGLINIRSFTVISI